MTTHWSDRQRDRLLATGTAVFAASLVAGARALEDSMLSDAVGAGGVPQGVGVVMALAAVALFAKSFIVGKVADGVGGTDTDTDADAGTDARKPGALAIAARTLGLVALLVVYGVLLPGLGYPLTISLLVLAVGLLAGAALRAPLLLCAVGSGPLLWALFDRALQVRMPVGSVWG